jgi:uncharacterized membrane protein
MSTIEAATLGAISGLRSTSGPAFLSRAASKGRIPLDSTPLAFLGSPLVSKALLVAMAGELVGDKLPTTPSRTALPPLLGRAASGGLVGAALSASQERSVLGGVLVGAGAAVAAAFAGERLRALAVEKTGAPDPLVALAEDALVLTLGSRATR